MHAGGADRFDRVDIVMRRDGRAIAPAERDQLGEQGAALGRRQILLAQAEPAAATTESRLGDLDEWPLRLAAVRDDEQRRARQLHRTNFITGAAGRAATRPRPSPGSQRRRVP